MRLISCLLLVLLLVGCATPSPTGFYWGKYPQTLYAYKKNPSQATRMQHQNELLRLVDYADSHHTRVPPGVYAELGKLYRDQGDEAIALNYFQKEQQLYPESTVLLDHIQHLATPQPTPKPSSRPISSKTAQPKASSKP